MVTVGEFEHQIWEIEGVRIVVRAPSGERVKPYDYKRAARGSWRATQLLKDRLRPCTDKREIVILDGNAVAPHRGTKLQTIRDSYAPED